MVPVTRWSDSQPARRLFNSWTPRTKRAAPASRTMARANWPTMRRSRKRRWPRSPVVPRDPLLRVLFGSSRRAKCAGATPKARAVKRQAPNAQPSDVPVDRENDADGIVPVAGNLEPVEGPHGHEDGTDAAGEGQQQGLDQQRAQHLGARGAEGGAHGELAGAGHRAGEQQVRQVGAGDEQHEAGETDQHDENASGRRGHERVVDRDGAPGAFGIGGGEVGSEAATEVGDEGFGLRAGEARGATPDEADPGGVAVAASPSRRGRAAGTRRPLPDDESR